jgi:hypothetical protein
VKELLEVPCPRRLKIETRCTQKIKKKKNGKLQEITHLRILRIDKKQS